jgi:hypothetical protein
MKNQAALNWLVPLIGVLALIATGVGLFWQDGGSPFSFTSLHGQTVQMFGQGIYKNDTLFTGSSYRGTDAVTLFLGIPLLVIAFVLSRRGSLTGQFLLASVIGFFFYNAIHLAMGAAYNNLFLVYVLYYSTSLFGFILAFTAIDLKALPARVSPRLPRRSLAIFIFISALAPFFLWGSDVITSLLNHQVPQLLGTNTTIVTYAFDLGVIVPVAFLAGIFLLQRVPMGYPLAAIILINLALIGAAVVVVTIYQMQIGIVLSPGQLVGFVGSWIVLALIAIWMAFRLFRNLSGSGNPS